jgi:hypothetical protein
VVIARWGRRAAGLLTLYGKRAMFARVFRRLHRREEGLETIQVAMIVAAAALMLAVMMRWWPLITAWFDQTIREVVSWKAGP